MLRALLISVIMGMSSVPAMAQDQTLDDFGDGADARWDYVADGVMGGVSTGSAVLGTIAGKQAIVLTGQVSTKNNGGFIQVRRMMPGGLPEGTEGLKLSVRGNGETYFVFIRTKEMTRPWYYYSAPFETSGDWRSIDLPLSSFNASHAHLRHAPDPSEVISVAFVAYGRDHDADLAVSELHAY